MSIIGKWKITDANVFDMSFKQTWREVEDLLADESVHPMQKAMARSVFIFSEDGSFLQLLTKDISDGEGLEAYDDCFNIAKKGEWKEENGKLYIAAVENGETNWQEIVPEEDGFVLFDMFRIARS